jgi:hypothetical protein
MIRLISILECLPVFNTFLLSMSSNTPVNPITNPGIALRSRLFQAHVALLRRANQMGNVAQIIAVRSLLKYCSTQITEPAPKKSKRIPVLEIWKIGK